MDLRLRGTKALVTGASRGIGRAIATTLAAEGAAVAICARGAEALESVAVELRETGATVHTEVVDIADRGAVVAFVRSAAEALGGLDIAVSNVSAGGGLTGLDGWRTGFDTDLLAFVALAEAAVDVFGTGGGSIVSVGTTSAADVSPPSGPGPYGALKAALLHHATGLARDLAPRGIRVNTVSPGPIEFPGGSWERRREDRPEFYAAVRAAIPTGRMGTPAEVAAAVAFLASPVASFCTGVNLVVDGGFLSRVHY